MAKRIYNIVRTADGGMTTYRVVGMETADNAAICQALTEAAKDAWKYMTTTPGAYTSAQLVKQCIDLREDTELPEELTGVQVVCGTFRCGVALKDWRGRTNYTKIFRVLSQFEGIARVPQNDRHVFTARMDLGELVCEARVVLPADMKAICDCCGSDPFRPSMEYPAIDLDRRCIVATDASILVARKFTLVSIQYEDKVPATFCMPKEVARMRGEVTVQLYERGCTVIDEKGTEVSVEHGARYPAWETVWPAYRSGMVIVDSKVMSKAVKGAAATLPERGKGNSEAVMLTHEAQSDAIVLCGYDGAEKKSSLCLPDITATDEVAWRLPVNVKLMQKALALNPKTMYVGYREHSALPSRIVMEDTTAEMMVMLHKYPGVALEESLRETDADYAACGTRGLYRCFAEDGWLLEQLETKYPTKPVKNKKPTIKKKNLKVKTETKPTFAEVLRKALLSA